jgi:hypothetical protein
MKIYKMIAGVIFLLVVVYGNCAFGSEMMQFELNDGSVMVGETVSFDNGVYTIKSSSIGIVKVKDADIRVIRKASKTKSGGTSQQGSSQINRKQIEGLQGQLMSDENIMNIILSLQTDPEFQAILKDPALMKAINSGDIGSVRSNEKFMQLLEHEKVDQIMKKLED